MALVKKDDKFFSLIFCMSTKKNGIDKYVIIAYYTLMPWLVFVYLFDYIRQLESISYFVAHYALVVILFGVSFLLYFNKRKQDDPFQVAMIATLSFLVFECVLVQLVGKVDYVSLNYVDWFIPMFIMTTTIYFVGKQKTDKKTYKK